MFGRRQVKTHTTLMREELGESIDHLRMAAAHAAGGASGALAPRVDAARKAVRPGINKARGMATNRVDTMRSAAWDSSKQAKKMADKGKKKMKKNSGNSGSRWPMMVGGILAAGAIIGAASTLMKRRQAQNSWDEYGSTRTTDDRDSMLESAKSTIDAGIDKASKSAEAVKDRASDLIGSKSTNSGPSADYNKQPGLHSAPATSSTSMTGGADSFSNTGSKNSRP